MGDSTVRAPRTAAEYRELPQRIPLEDMVSTQEADAAPDPTTGRDTETELMLRNAAG